MREHGEGSRPRLIGHLCVQDGEPVISLYISVESLGFTDAFIMMRSFVNGAEEDRYMTVRTALMFIDGEISLRDIFSGGDKYGHGGETYFDEDSCDDREKIVYFLKIFDK